jgi:hypothetical protein
MKSQNVSEMRSPCRIKLPKWNYNDGDLPKLLSLLHQGTSEDAVEIDISDVKSFAPSSIVSVLAQCHRWQREDKEVSLVGLESCSSLKYLQLMDFFNHLGVVIPEDFVRHAEGNNFIPVRAFNLATGSVGDIASEVTRCILPDANWEDDVYQLLQYAAGELISNAKYHSAGRAFVCGQFFSALGLVRIGVADDGIGIRESFVGTSRESDASDSNSAIRLALEPKVSSVLLKPKIGNYRAQDHRGVGLSVTRILTRCCEGRMTIASEGGWFSEANGREVLPCNAGFSHPGTLVSLEIHRDKIADYPAMRRAAMAEIGMGEEVLDTGIQFLD